MTKTVRVDPEAIAEIDHAIVRYERERDGLGLEFWLEATEAIDGLATPGPECGPVMGLPKDLGVRRKLLARFPYGIVFVEGADVVRVISVMHGHQQPAYWRRRL
jgi:plasmid stabilization system protein ParE